MAGINPLLRLPPMLRQRTLEHLLRAPGRTAPPSRVISASQRRCATVKADSIWDQDQTSYLGQRNADDASRSLLPAVVNGKKKTRNLKSGESATISSRMTISSFKRSVAFIRNFAEALETKRERAVVNRRLDAALKSANRDPKIKALAESLTESAVSTKHPLAVRESVVATSQSPAILDVEHIQKTMTLPTMQEYPGALPEFFDAKTVSGGFNNTCQALRISLQANLDYDLRKSSKGYNIYVCKLDVHIPDVCDETAIGECLTKQGAKHAAWLHLLAKMHASGSLKELLGRPDELPAGTEYVSELASTTSQLDPATRHQQKDAKAEIFNYAASLGMVPEFQYKRVVVKKTSRKAGKQSGVRVVIKLTDHDIEVSGAAKELKTAEIHAAVAFKRAAENKTVPQESDGLVPGPSYAILTTDTVAQFFTFYRETSRMRTEVEQDVVNGPIQLRSAQLTINDEPMSPKIMMPTQKEATQFAYLAGAITISKNEPQLLLDFTLRMKKDKGKILRPLTAPIDLDLPISVQETMRKTLVQARNAGLPDRKSALSAAGTAEENRAIRRRHVLRADELQTKSKFLKDGLRRFEEDPSLTQLRTTKASLPMNECRSQVLSMIAENQYSIVVGATGSGKSTQVPQMLLDDAIKRDIGATCNVICTQPRRIAATSVARRVAAERNEEAGMSVGYSVRFDSNLPQPGGSILYCTTGILLERLKYDPDGVLDSLSHFCLDEVHERDLNIDFLMIVLKKAIAARREAGKSVPKVILMSATLNTELFANYFAQAGEDGVVQPCPSISVPGRTFPVKEKYLSEIIQELRDTHGKRAEHLLTSSVATYTADYLREESVFSGANASESTLSEDMIIDWKRDRQPTEFGESPFGSVADEKQDAVVPYDLVALTVAHISKTAEDGAILAFLPGLDEIVRVQRSLQSAHFLGVDFSDPEKFKIIPLHSTIPGQDQAEVFKPTPPGCRKIILSTNIAETSVTVPDVKFVVDSGKLREKRYDQVRRISKLVTTWVSKSNCKQRAGRAGRVQEGHYYALFSKERRDSLRAVGLPELLQTDLQETCLSIKARKFVDPVGVFLAQAIEPPSPAAVSAAVDNLVAIEAFTEDEEITDLGEILSRLPIHPTLGKMIILGIVFRALDPILTLGAAASGRLFTTPMGQEAREAASRTRKGYAGQDQSDHLAMLRAFRDMRQIRDQTGYHSAMQRARELYIHTGAFKSIDNDAKQIVQILTDSGIIPRSQPGEDPLQYGPASLNQNSDNEPLIKSLLIAGLHPNLGCRRAHSGKHNRTPNEEAVFIHTSSTNNDLKRESKSMPYGTLFAYRTLDVSQNDGQLWARDTTVVSPLMAVLFGGKVEMHNYNRLTMDGWLPFFIKASDRQYATKLLLEFRKGLDRVMNSVFNSLAHKHAGPQWAGIAESRVTDHFANSVVRILDGDDAARKAIAAGLTSFDDGFSSLRKRY